MNNVSIVRLKDRLDALFESTRRLPDSDETRSHWARYLCVLVSGFIEESVRVLLTDYSSTHADKRIQNFIAYRLIRVQNPKVGVILDLLGNFDESWRDNYATQIRGELGAAIDSVVAVRHEIAHGKSTGISVVTISDYWKRVVQAIEILEATIG